MLRKGKKGSYYMYKGAKHRLLYNYFIQTMSVHIFNNVNSSTSILLYLLTFRCLLCFCCAITSRRLKTMERQIHIKLVLSFLRSFILLPHNNDKTTERNLSVIEQENTLFSFCCQIYKCYCFTIKLTLTLITAVVSFVEYRNSIFFWCNSLFA